MLSFNTYMYHTMNIINDNFVGKTFPSLLPCISGILNSIVEMAKFLSACYRGYCPQVFVVRHLGFAQLATVSNCRLPQGQIRLSNAFGGKALFNIFFLC